MSEAITSEQLKGLADKGLSYAQIGKVFGVSREWVRRLSDRYETKHYCLMCKAEIGPRQRYCPTCRDAKHKADQAKNRQREVRTFEHRPVVWDALRFFEGLGLDVALNGDAGRRGPELLVEGQGVKCNVIVPVSSGHQCRLVPRDDVDWWYLSDGKRTYVIPGGEVKAMWTYIGASNPLTGYNVGDAAWRVMLKGALCGEGRTDDR